jgi:hypothetical protein
MAQTDAEDDALAVVAELKKFRSELSGELPEEGAEAPGDAEFDEMFTVPDGAYKPRIFDLYTPKGRTTESAEDYTDDPAVLATKFDAETLARALREAVLPDGGQPASGEGLMPFDDGDEMVPAEALYEALQQGGIDADMLLAGIYDRELGGTDNVDKLSQRRDDLGKLDSEDAPDLPGIKKKSPREQEIEAARARNRELGRPGGAQLAVDLMDEYGDEKNQGIVEVANEILAAAESGELGEDNLSSLLAKYLPWSRGTAQQREAFRALWGVVMSIDGGDSSGTLEEGPDLGADSKSIQGIVSRAIETAEGLDSIDIEDAYAELIEEYGGFPEFVAGRNRIANGEGDLDDGSVAAAFYRLSRVAAKPSTVRLARSIGVSDDDPLTSTYLTVGATFPMDSRSFTANDLSGTTFASAMQFRPEDDSTQFVFIAEAGDLDSFSVAGASWFGENEHLGVGTYEVTDVNKVKDPFDKTKFKYFVTIKKSERKAEASSEKDIFDDARPNVDDWEMYGGQAGSNLGGFYRDPDGNEYYVKVPKSQAHAENEALAAALYELTDTPAARTLLGDSSEGTRIISPLIPGATNELQDRLYDEDYIKKLRDGFVVDAWLANWDVAGLVYDNVMSDADGNPVRVDPGGALMFRARGSEKGKAFGDSVGELDTLRDPDLNPQNSQIFGGITDQELVDQANRLRAIEPEAIDAVVDSIVSDPEMASTLKIRLRNRRADILRRILGVDESDNDKPVATTTRQLPARDLLAGDILDDGSFVVESAFVDDETPDGKISVQGYYPGGKSQRLEFSLDDINDVARGAKTPPKGDLEPLHRPEIAPDASPEEVEAWRDELARYEMDKAVRAALNCGGSGLTAAVGPENGPCSVPSVDTLVKKVQANPTDSAPQEVPSKDGVDVNAKRTDKALKDAEKDISEALKVVDEDEDVKLIVKKRAKKAADAAKDVVKRFRKGDISAEEAQAELEKVIGELDRKNDDLDYMAIELERVRDIFSGKAFEPVQDPDLPPIGATDPKTGRVLGVAKDGVTIIKPGMVVRGKNGFEGVVDRYANKAQWHGVFVIDSKTGKKINKVTWSLEPIDPADATGGFKTWDEKARKKYEQAVEDGKLPKAEAPTGATQGEAENLGDDVSAPEPEAPAATPNPEELEEPSKEAAPVITYDEATESEKSSLTDLMTSVETISAISSYAAFSVEPIYKAQEIREKLIEGEYDLDTLKTDVKDLVDLVNERVEEDNKANPDLSYETNGVLTQLKDAYADFEYASAEQLAGSRWSPSDGRPATMLPQLDILKTDPDDAVELWLSDSDVDAKKKEKYDGIASLAELLSDGKLRGNVPDTNELADIRKVVNSIYSTGKKSATPEEESVLEAIARLGMKLVDADVAKKLAIALRAEQISRAGLSDSDRFKLAEAPSVPQIAQSVVDIDRVAKVIEDAAQIANAKQSDIAFSLERAAQKTRALARRVNKMVYSARAMSAAFDNRYKAAYTDIQKRETDKERLRKLGQFNPDKPEYRDIDANPVDWSTPVDPAVLSIDDATARSVAIKTQRDEEISKRTTADIVQTLGDGSDIEDMVINVVTGMAPPPGGGPQYVSKTRYQYKLTAWAADDFFKDIVSKEDSGFTTDRDLQVPAAKFEAGSQPDIPGEQTLDMYTGVKYAASWMPNDGNGTYSKTVNIDGYDVTVNYVRARSSGDSSLKAFDGLVSVDVPEGAPTQVVAKAMQVGGVRDPGAASSETLRLLIENRMVSVLGGKADPTMFLTDPNERRAVLDKIFESYGVRPEDFSIKIGSGGKVEIIGPPQLGSAVRNRTGVDLLLHSLSTSNFLRDSRYVSEQDQVASGLADMLKEGQALRSTVQRVLHGSRTTGQSSLRDIETGGADYVFFTPSDMSSSRSTEIYYGASGIDDVTIVYDSESMFRRIDFYANRGDDYGFREVPAESPEPQADFVIDRVTKSSYEVMFKGEVSHDNIGFIIVKSKSVKEALVKALEDRGITEIGGKPVRQVVSYGLYKDKDALQNPLVEKYVDPEYLASVLK